MASVLYAIERHFAGVPPVSHLSRSHLADADAEGASVDHSLWTACLEAHVAVDRDGHARVDYAGISADPRFDEYVEVLASAPPKQSLAPAERLALYMNAYNVLAIGHIVLHERRSTQPVGSLTELSTPQCKVWDLPAGIICGELVTLGEIEHVHLRGEWDEPAIHACIVCASISCPNLRTEAFVASRLRAQMDEQMRALLSHPTKGMQWEPGLLPGLCSTLRLSRILLWFAADFGGEAAAARFAVEARGDAELASRYRSTPMVSRRFFGYDWSINRAR